ncbi:ArsR/SmtB family transcription factor [Bacillus tropicus]|uniref:ArsR/SmtB family transcription factor n=1 Tax=Bacillus tropicus TaxID=2026188 RepID=UPI0035E328CC
MLRVLAHPIRLQIAHELLMKKTSHVSALQQLLNLPQSTVSQHLNKMRNHKVVAYERKGIEVYYRVDDEKVKQILRTLMC